ncbi:MAG: NADH-quinone oxidoreductase subunit C, partial [Candidatus Bathyarchaeia archaeon]
ILATLRVKLPQNDYIIPTITDLIPGAMLHEREAHDLFGIRFEGNPDLRPLILPEDWPAGIYPLRKKD